MKIYTKGGDTGETSLFGGDRVSKDDLRIKTYGTIDELNSVLGIIVSQSQSKQELKSFLLLVQNDLFYLGSELATPEKKKSNIHLIGAEEITRLEKWIDETDAKLKPLQTFILPGGTQHSAFIHLARTVCRRAERDLITLHRQTPQRQEVLQYLNRLSDSLFVLARFANNLEKISDIEWSPKKD